MANLPGWIGMIRQTFRLGGMQKRPWQRKHITLPEYSGERGNVNKLQWQKMPSVTTGGKVHFLFAQEGDYSARYWVTWDRQTRTYRAEAVLTGWSGSAIDQVGFQTRMMAVKAIEKWRANNAEKIATARAFGKEETAICGRFFCGSG